MEGKWNLKKGMEFEGWIALLWKDQHKGIGMERQESNSGPPGKTGMPQWKLKPLQILGMVM